MNQQELAHIWANQAKEKGAASNFFFEGTKIYSYGYHYCAAQLFPNIDLALVNSRRYSNSTSSHVSLVWSAILPKYDVVCVKNPEPMTFKDHLKNLNGLSDTLKDISDQHSRSRLYKNQLRHQFNDVRESMNVYVKAFRIKSRIPKRISNWLTGELEDSNKLSKIESSAIKRAETEQKKREEVRKRIELAQYMNQVKEWKSHSRFKIRGNHPINSRLAFLRQSDDDVETTMGARVPLKEAGLLFNAIREGKDIKGFKIGHYTVDGINGVLTIGCHEIPIEEINEFASKMKWI